MRIKKIYYLILFTVFQQVMATFANPATAAAAVVAPSTNHYVPSKTAYELKEEARLQRLQRVEESRRLAKEVNIKKQERYRAAMVASVEQELFRRKVRFTFCVYACIRVCRIRNGRA